MKKGQLPTLIILAFVLTACKFNCQLGDTEKKDQQKDNTTQNPSDKSSSPQTLNGIQMNANGVQVSSAYLASESGDRISSDNKVSLGEKIVLIINSTGWKNTDNKSYIGISQTITTNTGATVLETGDMFAKYDETGINAEFTNILKLKAYITETKPEIEHFNVAFRVWDKKGNGEITGNYKFYIK